MSRIIVDSYLHVDNQASTAFTFSAAYSLARWANGPVAVEITQSSVVLRQTQMKVELHWFLH